jgi:hypothetical protein
MEALLTINQPDEALRVLRAELARRTDYRWKMRNGEEIHIRDMTDEHLKRTIAMLERNAARHEALSECMGEMP